MIILFKGLFIFSFKERLLSVHCMFYLYVFPCRQRQQEDGPFPALTHFEVGLCMKFSIALH